MWPQYRLKLMEATGQEHYVRLTARTDRGAIHQTNKYMRQNATPPQVFCVFYRPHDLVSGYINPSGADSTGQNWKLHTKGK